MPVEYADIILAVAALIAAVLYLRVRRRKRKKSAPPVRPAAPAKQTAGGVQVAPAGRDDLLAGVDRSELNPAVSPGLDLDVRAEADGGVDRAGALVKEVERPDVDRAAREVEAGRGGGLELINEKGDTAIRHREIIESFRACPFRYDARLAGC